MTEERPGTFVLSLGGSVFAPSGEVGGVDVEYLRSFEKFIRRQIAKGRRFFIVTGGGSIARNYRDAADQAAGADLTDEDLDWLGIHATRLNAHLFRTVFRDIAYERILKHYDMVDKKAVHQVVICAGWKPGWSTDYCAVMIANDYHVSRVINMSNIKQVYDRDPNQHGHAKPVGQMNWGELIDLVGDEWKPGMNTPFDPVASKEAQRVGLEVVVCDGRDFGNLEDLLDGNSFVGTTIR